MGLLGLSSEHKCRMMYIFERMLYIKVHRYRSPFLLALPAHSIALLLFIGSDDQTLLFGTLFKVFFGEQSSLAGGITDDDAAFLGGLNVRLEVATDSVSYSYKGELGLVKDIAMFCRQLEQPFGETVVVLLLLDSVVEGRMAEVFFSVSNQEGFKFCNTGDKGGGSWVRIILEIMGDD